jgi:hypothetical protein
MFVLTFALSGCVAKTKVKTGVCKQTSFSFLKEVILW